MTKVITAVLILAALYGGWQLFFYWERVKNEEVQTERDRKTATLAGDQLAGVPFQLESSLQAAQQQGAAGLTNWLKTYGASIQDPRKAWIELDYALVLSRVNPSEARNIFSAVKERTREDSPVWKRIKQLENTFK
jgi:hypothetical protein